MEQRSAKPAAVEQTLDLKELAKVLRNERVEVQRVHDRTDELFQKTLKLLRTSGEQRSISFQPPKERTDRYVPDNEDLRRLYLFAEAVGGYERLHDLVYQYSPGRTISDRYGRKIEEAALSEEELRTLEEYHEQINDALRNAHQYLIDNPMEHFTSAEMQELFDILVTASERSKELTRIIGIHLMKELEKSIHALNDYREKIRSVQKTVYGVFMIDQEVMFIPTFELIHHVNVIFRCVGNPYLTDEVDGVMLLAARNLLIDVVSFHSYYGKEQIYNLVTKGSGPMAVRVITQRIRNEVHKVFEACQADNKLVLTRVMQDAETRFELSVDAIESEAVDAAVEQVKVFLPREQAPVEPERKGFFRRLLDWLRG